MMSIIDTGSGPVRGLQADGVVRFRGIPYAASPAGPLRFSAPEPHPGWSEPLDATVPGPAVPQLASRLVAVMGPSPSRWSEQDSLTLNITAPAGAQGLPVLFWIHGGGFTSGSGGWPWYDGAGLAYAQDIVVVTVNYRLGAWGFMDLATDGPGARNRGLLDQRMALRWVHDNIAAFGGDPGRITVGGQSAGATSALALAAAPATRSLVHGLLLQSLPSPDDFVYSQDRAQRHGRLLQQELGIIDDPHGLTTVPAQVILDTTATLAQHSATLGSITALFTAVEDDATGVHRDLAASVAAVTGSSPLPVLVGSTATETTAFIPTDPAPDPSDVVRWMARVLPDTATARAAYEQYRAALPDAGPRELLVQATTDQIFTHPVHALGRALAATGSPVHTYEFGWAPQDSPWRSCHCIELPFLFGTADVFAAAPMMAGQDPPHDVVEEFQGAVGAFVRTSWPGTGPHPWPEQGERGEVHRIGQDGSGAGHRDLVTVWDTDGSPLEA